MGTWTSTLEDSLKNVLAYTTTQGASLLTLPLNAPSELNTTFSTTGADCTALFTQLSVGAVFIRLREDGTTRFWGQLTDVQVQADDGATVTATFQDVTGPLAGVQTRRPVTSGGVVRGWPFYFNTTQTNIINSLFGLRTGSISGSHHYGPVIQPVRSGTVSSTRKLTPDTATVLEVLQGISDLAYGTEWYASPSTDEDARVVIAALMGSDKTSSCVLEYGATGRGNVMSVTSQYLPPRNIVWVRDDQNKLTRVGYNEASVDAYGEYSTVVQKTERWSQTDSDVAEALLRPSWRQVLDLKLEPTTCPRPWTDFYLGDTLKIDVVRDGWSYVGQQRVNTITIDFDDQLVEQAVGTQFEVI